jgi:hypothetical protein
MGDVMSDYMLDDDTRDATLANCTVEYSKGQTAFWEKEPNPYMEGSISHLLWHLGFCNAMQDAEQQVATGRHYLSFKSYPGKE